jgi:SAM-dependent methyltransferase
MQESHYGTLYHYELHHWWCRVRREFVHDIIRTHYAGRSDLSIADIGCGAGALTKELEQYGSCVGIDPSSHAIDFCKTRGIKELRIGGAESTGCDTNSLDVVVCLDVLEHLSDDTKGVSEIQRILKPGGIAIIFVPAFMFLWGVTDDVSYHYRRYRLAELVNKFTHANFPVVKSTYFNTLLFPPIALIRVGVRLLRIKMHSEAGTGHPIINTLMYYIFGLERKILKYFSLPFGVSIMIVAKKK